ncbi:hypothetical protein BJ170DRAFT_726549 [Xylariales sp. AK1849]|nr:hypothetical protein BJ170DRAFT_726549 [Xylariales sp. AK1849]
MPKFGGFIRPQPNQHSWFEHFISDPLMVKDLDSSDILKLKTVSKSESAHIPQPEGRIRGKGDWGLLSPWHPAAVSSPEFGPRNTYLNPDCDVIARPLPLNKKFVVDGTQYGTALSLCNKLVPLVHPSISPNLKENNITPGLIYTHPKWPKPYIDGFLELVVVISTAYPEVIREEFSNDIDMPRERFYKRCWRFHFKEAWCNAKWRIKLGSKTRIVDARGHWDRSRLWAKASLEQMSELRPVFIFVRHEDL